MLKFIARCLNIFFGLTLFIIIIGLILLYEYTKNLPSYEQIINYKPDLSINIFDEGGEYLGAIFKENRIFIKSENIPPLIKSAVISGEDKDFYSNSGIDFNGILRSVAINIYNKITGEKKLVGGSTITQQIIKNIILSPEKTIKRKIQEARLALGITKYLNKDQILEIYINHIYLGNNTYGFAAAALGYFGKNLDELEISEAAMLAALPQAPSRYDPTKKENYQMLLNRRNWIISQMEKLEYITQDEAKNAIEKPIKIQKTNLVTQQKPLGSEYVIDEIKRKIVALHDGNEEKIYQNGLLVKSTIQTRLQEIATFSIRKGLLEYEKTRYAWRGPLDNFKTFEEYEKFLKNFNILRVHTLKPAYVFQKDLKNGTISVYLKSKDCPIEIKEKNQKIFKNTNIGDVVLVFADFDQKTYNLYQEPKLNGAIAAIDTKTGGILAMSGGFNYYANQYNRATQAMRQTGSSFKPLVYLSALEKGFTPMSIVVDEPISLPAGNGKWWSPKNHDGSFYGPMTMQTALARSRNLCTLYLARAVGLKSVIETCKRLKIFPENYNLKNYSIILGSQEATLIDMIRVYAIFANGGIDIETNIIDYIKDTKGNIVWKRGSAECLNCEIKNANLDNQEIFSGGINPIPPKLKENVNRLIEPKHDYYLLSMMKNVISGGTARSLNYLGGHLAGKTGTSNDAKDIWFIGMSNNVSFGIYVGFDQPKSLGGSAYGATVAIPIIKYFLDEAVKENLLGHDEEFDIIKQFENSKYQISDDDDLYYSNLNNEAEQKEEKKDEENKDLEGAHNNSTNDNNEIEIIEDNSFESKEEGNQEKIIEEKIDQKPEKSNIQKAKKIDNFEIIYDDSNFD
jgi:penicillin-binding protein 1A